MLAYKIILAGNRTLDFRYRKKYTRLDQIQKCLETQFNFDVNFII